MKRILIAALFATGASSYAFAQDAAPQAQPNATQAQPDATDTTISPPAYETTITKSPSTLSLTISEEDSKKWIGRAIYSSDGKNLGEVVDVVRDSDSKLTEIHADIGGFLGIGETRVRFSADEIEDVRDDRIVLKLNQKEADAQPAIE